MPWIFWVFLAIAVLGTMYGLHNDIAKYKMRKEEGHDDKRDDRYIKLMYREFYFELIPMLLVAVMVPVVLDLADFRSSTFDCYAPTNNECVCQP